MSDMTGFFIEFLLNKSIKRQGKAGSNGGKIHEKANAFFNRKDSGVYVPYITIKIKLVII